MAQFKRKLTPMEFMRKYCKHEPDFTLSVPPVRLLPSVSEVKAKVA